MLAVTNLFLMFAKTIDDMTRAMTSAMADMIMTKTREEIMGRTDPGFFNMYLMGF